MPLARPERSVNGLSKRVVELAFETKELREICEVQLTAEAELGIIAARDLRARLADLRAADSPVELVAGSPKIISSKPPGLFQLSLDGDYLLAYCANHVTNPVNDNGELQWPSVGRVKILAIQHKDG
jgi:hypothetical protein